jgi:butyryl-CoA dehydrogenase/short/branched chain acyl-CoA dehydrogenase
VTPLTTLREDERLFFDTVLAFARERVAPKVAAMDARGAFDPDIVPALFELGVMGIETPASFGGAESSFMNAILAVQAFARVDPSLSVLVDVQNTLVNNALVRWGTPAQKERYLTKLATEWVGSYALSEAASGSDAFALRARAERHGDRVVLTGQKVGCTDAAESSLFLVFANLVPTRGYKGITAFLVERGFPGFSVGK